MSSYQILDGEPIINKPSVVPSIFIETLHFIHRPPMKVVLGICLSFVNLFIKASLRLVILHPNLLILEELNQENYALQQIYSNVGNIFIFVD